VSGGSSNFEKRKTLRPRRAPTLAVPPKDFGDGQRRCPFVGGGIGGKHDGDGCADEAKGCRAMANGFATGDAADLRGGGAGLPGGSWRRRETVGMKERDDAHADHDVVCRERWFQLTENGDTMPAAHRRIATQGVRKAGWMAPMREEIASIHGRRAGGRWTIDLPAPGRTALSGDEEGQGREKARRGRGDLRRAFECRGQSHRGRPTACGGR